MSHRVSRAAAAALLPIVLAAAPARAANVDVNGGQLSYVSPTFPAPLANLLVIAHTGATYTIADPAEPALALGAGAVAAGCENVDATTVTCPEAALAAITIDTTLGADRIDLSASTLPAIVRGGDGDDELVGGPGAETFEWRPGDDSDLVDTADGDDTLAFFGSNASEAYVIAADGTGFDLDRNVGAVHMDVAGVETLRLATLGGLDTVQTQALATTQILEDAADDAVADVLTLDAEGRCPFDDADTIEIVGFAPIEHSGFQGVGFVNAACGATIDMVAGVLRYLSQIPTVANTLDVTATGADYRLQDAGEGLISPSPAAVAAGCANIAPDVVTCPRAAVIGFDVRVGQGDDHVALAGARVSATIVGGFGSDTLVGGSADDTFDWTPGGGSDTIDGGPGTDRLAFDGSNVNEIYTIAADGLGFTLQRNIAAINLAAASIELLELETFGGIDDVSTTTLRATTQRFTATTDTDVDTLRVDAGGICLERVGDTFDVEGRPSILFAAFESVLTANVLCLVDLCAAVTPSFGCTVNGVRDQLCQGTDGADVITGTGEGDVILGGGGNDRIRAAGGSDVVCGEGGDDVLLGARGYDTLYGGPGKDRIRGDSDDDNLVGNDDDDTLIGGSGNDHLYGGLGADRLKAGSGGDMLYAGDGDDRMDGGSGDDGCSDPDQPAPFPRCEP